MLSEASPDVSGIKKIMNDTLSIKPILPAQVGDTQLGTAREFARAQSTDTTMTARVNTSKGLQNPAVLSIGHYPKSKKQAMQRSIIQLKQRLSRVDSGSGAVVAVLEPSIRISIDIPEGVTQEELDEVMNLASGCLTASSNEVFHQLCAMQR